MSITALPPWDGVVLDSPTITNFGEWLRLRRKARGLTLEALAERTNLSHVAIGDWERGKRNPKRQNVWSVAMALSTDDMDDDDRARLVADAMTAAGFIPDTDTTDDEIERIPDQDIDYVVHAAEGLSQTDRRKLREYVELLVLANKAQSLGGTGEKKDEEKEKPE